MPSVPKRASRRSSRLTVRSRPRPSRVMPKKGRGEYSFGLHYGDLAARRTQWTVAPQQRLRRIRYVRKFDWCVFHEVWFCRVGFLGYEESSGARYCGRSTQRCAPGAEATPIMERGRSSCLLPQDLRCAERQGIRRPTAPRGLGKMSEVHLSTLTKMSVDVRSSQLEADAHRGSDPGEVHLSSA